MPNSDGLESHLESLIKKHRELDDAILELEKSYSVNEQLRRLKTEKLWLKDEIYRIKRQLAGEHINGF